MNICTKHSEMWFYMLSYLGFLMIVRWRIWQSPRAEIIAKGKYPDQTYSFIKIKDHYGLLATHLEEKSIIRYARLPQQP